MTEVYDQETHTEQWCAPDGSHVAYPELSTSSEVYHPEGGQLFGSEDEPDDESYEAYTGNAGPTLEYVYHRAVLVMWPRMHSLATARGAGVEAVLSLLAVRLQEFSTGSTGDTSAAQRQAQAALDAAISSFERPPPKAVSYTMYGRSVQSSTPAGSAPAYALQLLLAARVAGMPDAEQAAVRLLVMLSKQQGLSGAGAPAALARLVASLNSAELNTAVMQLVRRWGAAQAAACAELVSALAGLPQLQQQLVLAAGECLQAVSHRSSTGQASSAPPTKSWQLLLEAVQAQPGLQQQLALTAADTLLSSDTTLAQQQAASVLALSDLLLSSASLSVSHYGRFAAACLRRQDCQALLQQLLQSGAVKAAAAALPAVQQLVAARLAYLQARTAAPAFSWCMPQASLPGYPLVEAFLQGPQQEASFQLFNDLPHARNCANKYFNGRYGFSTTYSARATPGGRAGARTAR